MTRLNVLVFDADLAERLAAQAIDAGLYLSEDKRGRYYLTLGPDEIERRQAEAKARGKVSLNPFAVLDDAGQPLFAVTLEAVRRYLDSHTGEHRTT